MSAVNGEVNELLQNPLVAALVHGIPDKELSPLRSASCSSGSAHDVKLRVVEELCVLACAILDAPNFSLGSESTAWVNLACVQFLISPFDIEARNRLRERLDVRVAGVFLGRPIGSLCIDATYPPTLAGLLRARDEECGEILVSILDDLFSGKAPFDGRLDSLGTALADARQLLRCARNYVQSAKDATSVWMAYAATLEAELRASTRRAGSIARRFLGNECDVSVSRELAQLRTFAEKQVKSWEAIEVESREIRKEVLSFSSAAIDHHLNGNDSLCRDALQRAEGSVCGLNSTFRQARTATSAQLSGLSLPEVGADLQHSCVAQTITHVFFEWGAIVMSAALHPVVGCVASTMVIGRTLRSCLISGYSPASSIEATCDRFLILVPALLAKISPDGHVNRSARERLRRGYERLPEIAVAEELILLAQPTVEQALRVTEVSSPGALVYGARTEEAPVVTAPIAHIPQSPTPVQMAGAPRLVETVGDPESQPPSERPTEPRIGSVQKVRNDDDRAADVDERIARAKKEREFFFGARFNSLVDRVMRGAGSRSASGTGSEYSRASPAPAEGSIYQRISRTDAERARSIIQERILPRGLSDVQRKALLRVMERLEDRVGRAAA